MAATDILWVPNHIAERIQAQKKMLEYAKHRRRMETDAAYREEYEKTHKDTKPVFYMDTSTHGRPVMVVGGKGMWYLDMVELAQRLKEKPNPANELGKRDVKNDVATAVDRRLRQNTGTRTFHIKNNPCFTEEN